MSGQWATTWIGSLIHDQVHDPAELAHVSPGRVVQGDEGGGFDVVAEPKVLVVEALAREEARSFAQQGVPASLRLIFVGGVLQHVRFVIEKL